MNIETPDRDRASHSVGLDRLDPMFLNTEILRTYIRRNAAFGHDATSTASTAIGSPSAEGLGIEDAKRWDPERWTGRPHEKARFQLEIRLPSHSRPDLRRSSVGELICSIREELKAEFAERLFKRLHDLARICEEEYPEQAPISPESLGDFVAFVRSMPNLAYPSVVLTPAGNIQAEWHKAKNRHWAVEFAGNGDVHFLIFAPDPKKPYKTIRASGVATTHSLVDILRPFGIDSWVTESGRRVLKWNLASCGASSLSLAMQATTPSR